MENHSNGKGKKLTDAHCGYWPGKRKTRGQMPMRMRIRKLLKTFIAPGDLVPKRKKSA